MTNKNAKLGKNLTALLLGELPVQNTVHTKNITSTEIAIDLLKKGKYQPRITFTETALSELAESIKVQGIIQPIVVRQINSVYEILAGERRWRAAKLAGLNQVPIIIKNVNDQEALAISLIENIQRENLNVIEEANAIEQLISEFNLTHQQVADFIGKNRTTITNTLRLLTLHESVKKLLEEDKIEMGHARALLSLPAHLQSKFARTIVEKNYTVRQIESLVKSTLHPKTKSSITKVTLTKEIETTLSKKLKTTVKVQDNNGIGKIVLFYKSKQELDELVSMLNQIKHT
jgi:ParB family chromosome partitioning protein